MLQIARSMGAPHGLASLGDPSHRRPVRCLGDRVSGGCADDRTRPAKSAYPLQDLADAEELPAMRDNGAIETRPALFGLSLSSSGRLGSRDRFGDEAQGRDRAVLAARPMPSKRPPACKQKTRELAESVMLRNELDRVATLRAE